MALESTRFLKMVINALPSKVAGGPSSRVSHSISKVRYVTIQFITVGLTYSLFLRSLRKR